MNNHLLPALCQLYTLLLLLATAIMSAMPEFLTPTVLLLILLVITLRRRHPRYNIGVYSGVIFLAPLALAPALENTVSLPPAAIHVTAVVMTLPAFFLLDNSLQQNTLLTRLPMKKKPGIYISIVLTSLLVLAGIMILISLVVNSRVLLYTSVAFILYLTGTVLWAAFNIPQLPLTAMKTTARIIAGTSGDLIVDLTNRASTRIHCQFGSHEPWLKVIPLAVILEKGRVKLNISYTPPLAGNAHPQIESIAKDPRGFVQIHQILEPIDLRIIPRARYAEWLARKYLERSGVGMTTTATIQLQDITKPTGGTDYQESRDYTPGDELKDIDWKHTLRLSQLIVKDFTNDEESATIIAVNLAVADAEEADKLSFKLVTTALTLARENVPAALTAYNHQGVVFRTNVSESDEILKQALLLLGEITPIKMVNRHTELADINDIKRNINQLKNARSEPAQRLLNILDFKYRSIEEFTKNHPATTSLLSTTRQVPAPATILLVSQLNHDAEAIRIITDKLWRRKFTTVTVEMPARAIPR